MDSILTYGNSTQAQFVHSAEKLEQKINAKTLINKAIVTLSPDSVEDFAEIAA